MPSASNEDRERMQKWFGDLSDDRPCKFLQDHGYTLTPGFLWYKPTSAHSITDAEWYCLMFLVDEWDYGGIKE